jgi:rhodanese-related sulfurtransferase
MAQQELVHEIANEILPRLWLGNVRASKDEGFIRQNNIQVVFNCTKNLPFSPLIPIKYRVPVDDNLEEEEIRNLKLWSPEIAHKLLTLYNQGHTILVHCYAGMQRSAACVAIFLIALKHMSGQDAMKYIRSRRPVAFQPRANFGRSIEFFEHDFFNRILPSISRKT